MPKLATVFTRRDQLARSWDRLVAAGVVTPVALAEAVVHILPDADYRAVFKSVAPIVTSEYWRKPESIRKLAWLLCGNASMLKRGEHITFNMWPQTPAHVPIQILSVQKASDGRQGRLELTARILAGYGASTDVTFRWRDSYLRYFAAHPKLGLGFDPHNNRRYVSPKQIVNLRFLVQVVARGAGVRVGDKPRCTNSLREHNIKVMDMRMRKTFTCPRNFTHACHVCPIGYKNCPAGTHAEDYVYTTCTRCNAEKWHDPAVSMTICLDCVTRQFE